jgi:SAM-dependent methyltransferase
VDHADHLRLIRDGVPGPGGTWADFGAGGGAFTLALADLLGPDATIVAIDRDAGALGRLTRALKAQFPAVGVRTLTADYAGALALPPLDGAVAANSLHFLAGVRRLAALSQIRAALHPGAPLIIVEYNLDRSNTWVPHPFTYEGWEALAREAGLVGTRLLTRRASRTSADMYAAVSFAPSSGDEHVRTE